MTSSLNTGLFTVALIASGVAFAQQSTTATSTANQELSCLQRGVAPRTAADATQGASTTGGSASITSATSGTSSSAAATRGNSATGSGATGTVAAQLSTPEVCFLDQAARSGLFEVKSSQLALQRSTNPTVKAFAQKIIADHTAANNRLKALAAKYGARPPAQVNTNQQALLNTLETMRGSAFDLTYLAQQVSAHFEAVDLFSSYSTAAAAPNQDVRQFASQTLPVLQGHVSLAQRTQRQVAQGTSGTSSSGK